METLQKIALGGGCHWCTEAVFQSLIGVLKVEQGFVASTGNNSTFSEAVIVHFNPEIIPLKSLIEIHLHTHKSTSSHSMRNKYRSAVYVFSEEQKEESKQIIKGFQSQFENQVITEVLPFASFKASRAQIQNYYYSNPEKPFCETFINPKLKVLLSKFLKYTNQERLKHIKNEQFKAEYSK
ncbi:peptide methionine sulfoxide reductase [Algibacter amylolyticus]|uniref:peptide-methionine (S)-S-oxide reductase n=1 Tax=Algibacter amylolyticus TaxID=1608400 RepID=A0A5M7BIM4_9FLAO|nr:peptide-methionine (S)-S-oxide reductase [Algibacter amylolyticus]KAA5828027.1 peptide methionine sulfoxide reductase [Algibacter amylolyticus]MBB5267270.1 peptide-methionine (S)-S-oxide reductase [Algibacter amylolyticus]TSJ82272.1 peptide methionine sulfoxide reductase [Algibacter amylolyticus]